MKLLKRWLAFFVVVVLVIGVAFNSRGPLRASHIGEENTTTNDTGEPDAQTAQEGQQQTDGTAGENTEAEEPAPDTEANTEQPDVPTEQPEEKPAEPEVHQDAMELSQVMTGENGEAVCNVTADIPEGTFEANTSDVTMEVTYAAADASEQIKGLMNKAIAEGNVLGEYFLYNVIFKVNGEQAEPGKEIKITFEQYNFQIKDTKKATTFYYNEANSAAGNAEAEIVKITQKSDKIEELQNAGQSTDNIDDYDLSEISLREDGSADKIMMEGRRSTIYGCYLEEQKPVEVTDDKKEENKTEETKDTVESFKYEGDDVVITVTPEKKGIIPENVKLQVLPILPDQDDTKDQYREVEEHLKEKAENEEYDIAGFIAYDISFIGEDGKEIEPDGNVKVSMDYKKDVIPEEVKAKNEKSSENEELNVTVMHLEEDGKGNVANVVDMVADSKTEAAVETTEAAEVKKAEFVTDSFSTFMITWTVGEGYYQGAGIVNVHYVNEQGSEIDGKQTENISGNTMNDIIDLAEYADDELPDGYQVFKYTLDNINGTEINSQLKLKSASNDQKTICYQKKGKSEWTNWLTFNQYGNKKGNVYIVCKKSKGIYISDMIKEDGSLKVNQYPNNVESYTWLKSDKKDGQYTAVERVAYQGDVSNISTDGKKLYPAYDDGARKWYKVKATLKDGTIQTSDPKQVIYYGELENGSFEIPQIANGNTSTHTQLSNANYKSQGGVWQTTGTKNGQDIEILRAVNGGSWEEKGSYAWYGEMKAAEGYQFAELNCEAAGALYQDVLTYSGQSLNWWLSHRARGLHADSASENDTMYLVIMPTSVAMTAGNNESELDTQDELASYLWKTCGVNITREYSSVGNNKEYSDDENGIYVYRVTSNDQFWNSVSKLNDYTAKSSLTRFFFVAGDTESGSNTVGNFLDEVGFSQELPPVNDDEFSIEIQKKFEGLDNAGLNEVRKNIQFEINAVNKNTGKVLTEKEVKDLFGINVISGKDMIMKVDGSLYYSIANRQIKNSSQYEVTIKEINAGLSGYELTSTAKTTVIHNGESAEPTEDAVIRTLQGKTTAKVEFKNNYKSVNQKNVNFTKVWDDNANQFKTRPEALEVTLKASIVVENEQGNAQTITLDMLEKTATLTEAGGWKTSWKVPVYYQYNDVDVKINYTVEEGTIDSEYVYEAANSGIAHAGDGKDYKSADFSDVVTKSEEAPNLLGRSAASSASLAGYSLSAQSAEKSQDTGLGEPAHKKYIEYNSSTAEYTLNLDVTGAKGEAQGADILFIIDTSGSMGSGYGSVYNNLLPSLKKLLTDSDTGIIDRVFATEGNVNSVAYVSFSGKDETKVSSWYQTSGKNTLKNNINNLKATGGTNWTYAFQRASTLLAQKSQSKNEKVVIFLSDGRPTYSMSGNTQTGNGSDSYNVYYDDAASVVENSSSLSKAQLYSVYLTSGTKPGMKTFSDKLSNSDLVDGTDLKEALDEILSKVIPTYKNVVITDTLSDYVEFAESNPTITVKKKTSAGVVTTLKSNEFRSSITNKSVKVSLLNGDSLEDGATYTISFKVKPSEQANQKFANGVYTDKGDVGTGVTSAGKDGFYSNVKDSTRVSYSVNEKDDSASYPMPVVQVTTHELTYTKVWRHPDSVAEPKEDVILDVVYTDGTKGTITLKEENDYTYTEQVPVTKKISSITEKQIDGYAASYEITDGTSAVVTNSYSKVTTSAIQVIKKWVGGTSHNPIEVSLYRSKGDESAEKYDTVTLSEENEWTHRWDKLPLSEGGGDKEIFYTYAVREENTPENYQSNIVYDSKGDQTNVTITNTYDPNSADEDYYIANVLQTEKVTLMKTWDDNDNDLKVRPNTLQINVTDGNGKTLAFYLNSSKWEKTVTLLKHKNADYTAEEVLNSESYEQVSNDKMTTPGETTFSFVNKIKTTSIVVHKDWNDGEIETRPGSIKFTLQYRVKGSSGLWLDYASYNITDEDIVEDRQWTKEVHNLPTIYEYRVTEGATTSAYYSKVTNSGNVFTITNTLKWDVRKTSEQLADEEVQYLSGAEFELKKEDTVIATGSSGSDGMIVWTTVEGQNVNLKELNGEYTIHETKAPQGYILSSKDWVLTFNNGLLTQLDGTDVSGDSENGVLVSITNEAIYELPSAGGPGIFWYTVGGILLMSLAGLLTLYKNKRKRGAELLK